MKVVVCVVVEEQCSGRRVDSLVRRVDREGPFDSVGRQKTGTETVPILGPDTLCNKVMRRRQQKDTPSMMQPEDLHQRSARSDDGDEAEKNPLVAPFDVEGDETQEGTSFVDDSKNRRLIAVFALFFAVVLFVTNMSSSSDTGKLALK